MKDRDWTGVRIKNQRSCHDCGKKTNDYRCPRCWTKLRKKAKVIADGEIYGVDDEFLYA